MNKEVRMKFGLIPNNMGDMLNTLIPEELFGVSVKHVDNIYQSETTGIGSYLGDYFREVNDQTLKIKYKEIAKKIFYSPSKSSQIRFWSTGFIRYPSSEEFSVRNISELKFSSVRGELSKNRVEKILGRSLDITTGDAGLLANRLVKKPEKKYEVGIIPHFREKDEEIFKKANSFYKNSTIIDLGDEPHRVISKIGECELIISSSLHGLIVADSFGIPNIRVTKTNNLFGDGFKFDDYYSSFDMESKKIHLEQISDLPSKNFISDNYSITKAAVELKQKEIYDSFFKYL